MAAALLQRDALDSPNQTHLAQNWAQEGRRFTVNDGEINATITDGQACFNLMRHQPWQRRRKRRDPWPARAFTRLLENLGKSRYGRSSSPPRACATGSMATKPRLNGGEDEVYMARLPGYLTANQPIQDVSELRLIAGMDAALYLRLLPLFAPCRTTPCSQRQYAQARPAPLLMALFPAGVNLQQARQLLQDRPRSGWNSVAAFLALPLYSKAIPPPPARLTVHSERLWPPSPW
jgi:general secretion pathway protein K